MAHLLDRLADVMRRHLDAEAQLRVWLALFMLSFPLYPVGFLLPGSWLSKMIYWLSVLALHLTAMTGVTAAEAVVQTDTDPSLQNVAESTERESPAPRDTAG